MVVLEWIGNSPARWQTFVAHRVGEIQRLLPNARWRHVPSQENPADCASRVLNPQTLRSFEQWWRGPTWLSVPIESWPEDVRNPSRQAVHLEENKHFTVAHVRTTKSWDLAERFSSWLKLLRVTAYMYRFINASRKKFHHNIVSHELTVVEFKNAKSF